jgi:hypothetical protein
MLAANTMLIPGRGPSESKARKFVKLLSHTNYEGFFMQVISDWSPQIFEEFSPIFSPLLLINFLPDTIVMILFALVTATSLKGGVHVAWFFMASSPHMESLWTGT